MCSLESSALLSKQTENINKNNYLFRKVHCREYTKDLYSKANQIKQKQNKLNKIMQKATKYKPISLFARDFVQTESYMSIRGKDCQKYLLGHMTDGMRP